MSAILRWSVAALLGVALAVALTLATLQLTGQHVGLSGAPADAGRGLVPTTTAAAPHAPGPHTRTVTVTTPSPPSDDGAAESGSDD